MQLARVMVDEVAEQAERDALGPLAAGSERVTVAPRRAYSSGISHACASAASDTDSTSRQAIELVVETRAMGSNPKIANLINMSERIAHDVIVLADSDIRVRRDYLSRLVGALERSAAP